MWKIPNNKMETYIKIKNFENYGISKMGEIYSFKRGIIRKPTINWRGYSWIRLCKDGKYTFFFVHRLVALIFIPNIEEKRCVNHKNGIKTDNRIENLEWCTHSENMVHSYKNGFMTSTILNSGKFGKEHPKSKKVHCLNESWDSLTSAAKYFKVSKSTIGRWCKAKTEWRYA